MSRNDSSVSGQKGVAWVATQGVLFVFFLISVVVGDSLSDIPGVMFIWVAGVFVAVGGAVLTTWSVLLHGSQFSPFPFPVEGMAVIDRGPYRFVRHPMYAGIVFFTLGVGLAYTTPVVLVSSLTFLVFFAAKSAHEEAMMVKYMDGYAAYRSSVPWRIVPFIV